jgi:hypothetical protein
VVNSDLFLWTVSEFIFREKCKGEFRPFGVEEAALFASLNTHGFLLVLMDFFQSMNS